MTGAAFAMRWPSLRRGWPSISRAALACTCCLTVLVVLAPLLWALVTSLKTEANAVTYPPRFWPAAPTAANYARVLSGGNFLRELANSLLYAGAAVGLSLACAAPAGYAAARFEFPGKAAAMLAILATAMIPPVALIIPIFGILNATGLLNSITAIVIIEAAHIAPQGVWFIQTFVKAIPPDIEEAAAMDGAGRVQCFLRIVLPLIRPGLGALAILGLITVWNDYLTVAIFAPDTSRRTLQVSIVDQVLNGNGVSWSFMMAFVIVASAPVLAMFLLAQRWFIAGLVAGGVKG